MPVRLHLGIQLGPVHPFHRDPRLLHAAHQLLIAEPLHQPDLMDLPSVIQQLRDDILSIYELCHTVSPILTIACHSSSSRSLL